MHVIALNGSAKKQGNTYQALQLVTAELEKAGITTEIIQVGNQAREGCRGCGSLRRHGKKLHATIRSTKPPRRSAGRRPAHRSPVHYASIAGNLKTTDRLSSRRRRVSGKGGGRGGSPCGARRDDRLHDLNNISSSPRPSCPGPTLERDLRPEARGDPRGQGRVKTCATSAGKWPGCYGWSRRAGQGARAGAVTKELNNFIR
jgi:hypothetical protein